MGIGAIEYAVSLVNRAIDFGFDWEKTSDSVDAAVLEAQEIKKAVLNAESPERIQEEMGDFLLACITVLIREKIDIENTLIQAGKKFEKRLSCLELLSKESGFLSLRNQPIEIKIRLWKQVKDREKDASK